MAADLPFVPNYTDTGNRYQNACLTGKKFLAPDSGTSYSSGKLWSFKLSGVDLRLVRHQQKFNNKVMFIRLHVVRSAARRWPAGQVHMKEPNRFWHECWQPPLFTAHSSTSAVHTVIYSHSN